MQKLQRWKWLWNASWILELSWCGWSVRYFGSISTVFPSRCSWLYLQSASTVFLVCACFIRTFCFLFGVHFVWKFHRKHLFSPSLRGCTTSRHPHRTYMHCPSLVLVFRTRKLWHLWQDSFWYKCANLGRKVFFFFSVWNIFHVHEILPVT